MKRIIKAAEGTSAEDMFKDQLNELEDTFNYAVDGLSKLATDGYAADAKEIAENLKSAIDSTVSKIASIMA